MVDIDGDIKAKTATEEEAVAIVNQAKSDVKDYVYVRRTVTRMMNGK